MFALIAQMVVSVALVVVIVLQSKGTGLGAAFGGTSYHTKRGMEKSLFAATIALSIVFIALAMVNAL